eukprot:6051504-Amphidinium_carterae.1
MQQIGFGTILLEIIWVKFVCSLCCHSQVAAKRISFPDTYYACDAGNTRNPETGTVACDFREACESEVMRKIRVHTVRGKGRANFRY